MPAALRGYAAPHLQPASTAVTSSPTSTRGPIMAGHGDPDVLEWLIPHVFLPPQLPQAAQNETEERSTSLELLRLLIKSVIMYRERLPHEQSAQWRMIERMLTSVQGFVEAPMSQEGLSRKLRDMRAGDILPLHIRAQNAAVIVYKRDNGSVFAVHEVSPKNEAVYSTAGKLLITFPGPAVYLPASVTTNTSFVTNMSLFLSHMDVDLPDTPHTRKAGSSVTETRDTVDPRYITQLFLGILHGCEGASNADVHRHQKRVAEEVMWNNALKPWRRLPLWLVIRSTLQTTLASNNDYKAFMIFFLTRFMSTCLAHESHFPSDLLYAMRSKIARRLGKLGNERCPAFVLHAVAECVQATEDVLRRRWKAVEDERRQQAPWVAPSTASLPGDTKLSLDNSKSFLLDALQRNDVGQTTTTFSPTLRARFVGEQNFLRFKNGRIAHLVANDIPLIVLADFESCVRRNLFTWVDGLDADGLEEACDSLHLCFQQYQTATKKHYSENNPHDQSITVLTLLAIWTAMDRVATRAYPLLASYSPEIPTTFLEPLLLQRGEDIQLALEIEQHIRHRHEAVHHDAISVFAALPHAASFASQMYAHDESFAQLYSSIIYDAENERSSKIAELNALNQKHSDLLQQWESLEHTNSTRNVWRGVEWVEEDYHNPRECERCKLKKEDDALDIQVYEWPLPSDEISRQLVIFELNCPAGYSFWREMTYTVLTTVGRISSNSSAKSKKCERLLRDYDPLSPRAVARISPITLGSDTKAFINSHYRTKKIPAVEADVCLNNALTFRLFHSVDSTWISAPPLANSSIAHLCSPKLSPDSLYAHLQFALEGTTHSSNAILADQASCPQALSIHEHLSFASLRSGGNIQWLNIARELRARTLSLSSDEVHHLITQAVWQLGPLSDENRRWHMDLTEPTFCARILDESSFLLDTIGENWKEHMSIYTIVLIALRVLTASSDSAIHTQARGVLFAARRIISSIRDSLWQRLSRVKSSALSSAQRLVCEAAAICASTYDGPAEHIAALVGSPSGDNSYELFRSMILVRENTPVDIAQAPLHTQYLLRRHERALHRLEGTLREYIATQPSGLHRAVESLWPTYRADGTEWSPLPSPSDRHIHRSFDAQGRTQFVHLNLLSGTLLVNGKPLGRLPIDIVRHPIFRRLFGQSILEVVPAADPGMQYETRGSTFDSTISFAMHADKMLTVRARRVNPDHSASATLQLIPHTVFVGDAENDLPQSLIHEHVHWMNLDTGTVEFRPMDSRWSENSNSWHLVGLREDHPMLCRGQSSVRLIDIRSPAFHAIYACLSVLELADFTLTTYDGERLRAELPRLRLSFFMNDSGDLENLNYRDTVVDSDQAAHGTFFGLQNQLVLKRKGDDAQTLPRSRRILIPDGKLHCQWENGAEHVSVSSPVQS